MIDVMKWNKIYCKHEYEKIGFYQKVEDNIRYPIHIYKCKKCYKYIEVDGRYDWIENRSRW